MVRIPATQRILNERAYDLEDDVLAAAKRMTENSETTKILLEAGANIYERTVPHNPQRYHRSTTPMHKGIQVDEATILGQHKPMKGWESTRTRQGVRGFEEFELLAKTIIQESAGVPGVQKMNEQANAKFGQERGLMDHRKWAETAAKFVKPVEVDPNILKHCREALHEVFEEMQTYVKGKIATPFSNIQKWSSQFKPNKNAGWDERFGYGPISKEQMVNEVIPHYMKEYSKILGGGWAEFEDIAPNWDKWHGSGFYRTPGRVIHGGPLKDKPLGAFVNFHLIDLLRHSFIAWANKDDMYAEMSEATVKGASAMADDLSAFDTTIAKELCRLVYEVAVESDFLHNMPEVRNAFLYLLKQFGYADADLQFSATHAFDMDNRLWSGHGLTQALGSIVHRMLFHLNAKLGSLVAQFIKLLSDDGWSTYAEEVDEVVSAYEWCLNNIVTPLGMKGNLEKTVFADTNVYSNIRGIEVCNNVPFLQDVVQPGTEVTSRGDRILYFGNILRRITAFYTMERTPSDEAIDQSLNQWRGSLPLTSKGGKLSPIWFDIWRIMQVSGTIGPGNPWLEETLQILIRAYPNGQKRFSKFIEATDERLFDEELSFAGGTLKTGTTLENVRRDFKLILENGTFERSEPRQIV